MDPAEYFSRTGYNIISALEQHGYEAYFVGGCVRDYLLGRPCHDEDIVTNATPDQIKIALQDQGKNNLPFIDNGGEKYGTVVVNTQNGQYEVTTFRTDGKYTDQRHPDKVVFASTIEEDLGRRDFTINAIAFSPAKGFVDPYGGREDIREQLISCVGDADKRLSEDPLRIMRGLRFANTLSFDIEEGTYNSIRHNAEKLQYISKERIRNEFLKILAAPSDHALYALYDTGIFKEIAPALHKCFEISEKEGKSIGQHSLEVMKRITNDHTKTYLKLAALFHEVAKSDIHTEEPATADNGQTYARLSANITKAWMQDLRFSNQEIRAVCSLIEQQYAGRGISGSGHPENYLCSFLINNQDKNDEFFEDIYRLQKADAQPDSMAAQDADRLHSMWKTYKAMGRARRIKDLEVNGHDLLQKGAQPKQIPKIQKMILRDVITGKLANSRDALLNRIPFYVAKERKHEQDIDH